MSPELMRQGKKAWVSSAKAQDPAIFNQMRDIVQGTSLDDLRNELYAETGHQPLR